MDSNFGRLTEYVTKRVSEAQPKELTAAAVAKLLKAWVLPDSIEDIVLNELTPMVVEYFESHGYTIIEDDMPMVVQEVRKWLKSVI